MTTELAAALKPEPMSEEQMLKDANDISKAFCSDLVNAIRCRTFIAKLCKRYKGE